MSAEASHEGMCLESQSARLPGNSRSAPLRRRRWRPPAARRGLLASRLLVAPVSVFAVAIMILSSSDLSSLHPQSSGVTVASSPAGSPPLPFLPYVVDPSQFPAPDTILSTLGNISDPQLTAVSDLNQTIFELVYTKSNPDGSNGTVMYTAGRYDPAWAVCILTPSNCTEPEVPHLPINWSSPVTLLTFAEGQLASHSELSLASSGSSVAVAVSIANRTNVSIAGNFGLNTGWTSITPTAVPGASPRLALSPCELLLTTLRAESITATTFDLPCGLPQTPVSVGGGSGESRFSGFSPTPPPIVTSVTPNYGEAGSPVTIHGSNFAPSATVSFAGTTAWTVSYVSSTKLTAVAPPGSGLVNVTVTVGGVTSAIGSGDQFIYLPPAPPAVETVVPSVSLPGSFVNVTGAGFDSAGQVRFGGGPALQSIFVSATDIEAQVPWGVGKVDVQVVDRGLTSTANPGDVFGFGVKAAILAASNAAAPVLASDPQASGGVMEGIVATQESNQSTVLLRSTNGGLGYTSFLIGHYTTSTGSPLLSSLGSTRVFSAGGTPAQAAGLSVGGLVFSLYTTQLENRTVVETAGSTDGGETWTGPYPSAPIVGTMADPMLAASPDGYVYATWLENGGGDWQLDQAVYAESGQLLYGPSPIPGSSSGTPGILAPPSVAVDGLARPIFLWAAENSSDNLSELRFTGAFPTASSVAQDLSTAFQQAESEPWNFRVQGSQLSAFEGEVRSNLSAVESILNSGDLCTIQSDVVRGLGPAVSANVMQSTVSGAPAFCGVSVTSSTTEVVNATGPGAANTYLGVYLDWLAEAVGYSRVKEPFWPGAPGSSNSNTTVPFNPGSPHFAPDDARNTTGQFYTYSVRPVTVNPNALWLNVSGIAFGRHQLVNETSCYQHGGGVGEIDTAYDDTPTSQWAIVYANQTGGGTSFALHGFWQSSYVTDLVPGSEGVWAMTVFTNYSETKTISGTCDGDYTSTTSAINFTTGMPQQVSVTLTGNFTTAEETVPGGLVVHQVGNRTYGGNAFDYIAWNNSVVGWSNTTVKGAGYTGYLGSFANVTSENTGQFAIPLNRSYTAWANLTSEVGGANISWQNQFDSGLNGGVNSSAETGSSSCSFVESVNPIKITWITGQGIANVTTSSVTLTWYANSPGRGWAQYNATDDGVYTQTALEVQNASGHPAGYPYRYTAQLSGLSPWNVYMVTVGVSTYSGCLEFDNGVPWRVQVHSLVQPQEMDYPYDSVTHEGGGARLTWSVPSQFASRATFDNGTVTYCEWVSSACAVNTTVLIPLTGLSTLSGGSQYAYYWLNDTFQVNFTALTPNATYNVTILLNYTLSHAPFVAQSDPYYFQYQRDSSGDGLTDWEKVNGWNVTTQRNGGFSSRTVWANPSMFSTNGLTSDFLEKEFGLDLWTVSTTNDGLLDTWNLTFDLGPGNATLPTSGFDYWYENASYDFANACPDPELKVPCSFVPVSGGGNLTDNGPGSSEILWNATGPRSALAHLQGLIASQHLSPLRAVTGSHGGVRTITVWGKLSWGADPLAYSTSHYTGANGAEVPDGAMVDPLGYADLNVTINSWSMSGLDRTSGAGVAAFIHVSSSPTDFFPAGRVDYSDYSVNSSSPGAGDSCPADCATPFTVVANVPVESDEQFALLNFSMVADNSSGGSFVWDNTSMLSVDLGDLSTHTVRLAGNDPAQNYTLNVTYRVAPVFSKATTILLVPGDNSTLSGLPLGLQRYTGEQDFILLELNDTVSGTGDTLASVAIPYVNSTAVNGISAVTYTVGLTAGLNNLLVPRSLFKDSPLGEALLNMTFQNVTGHNFQGGLNGTFEPGYWIARDTGTVFNGINYSLKNSPGGANDPSGYIKVYSNRNQNCTQSAECGGVPSDSAIQAGVPSYAIEAIFALNVSTAVDLNDLLAGLVLNESGNFTARGFAATPYLPSLGLSAEVTSVLANPVFFNSGGYGAPTYTPPPPSPAAWQQFGSAVWNAVSGIPLLGALISAAWNWVSAAASYVAYLAAEVANWGLSVLSQTSTILKEVAGAIVWAIDALAAAVIAAVQDALRAITDPLNAMNLRYCSQVESSFTAADGDAGNVSPAHSQAFWDAVGGSDLQVLLGLGIAVTVALTLIDAVEMGGSALLVGLLVPLVISLAIVALPAGLVLSLPGVASFDGSAITAIQNLFSSTWLGVLDAWEVNKALADAVMAISPLALVILTMIIRGPVGDGGPVAADYELIGSLIFAILAFCLYGVAHNAEIPGESWPGWVNDTFVASAVFASIGATFGLLAAKQATGTERVVGLVSTGVAASSIGVELADR